jgi:hypothetical protein
MVLTIYNLIQKHHTISYLLSVKTKRNQIVNHYIPKAIELSFQVLPLLLRPFPNKRIKYIQAMVPFQQNTKFVKTILFHQNTGQPQSKRDRVGASTCTCSSLELHDSEESSPRPTHSDSAQPGHLSPHFSINPREPSRQITRLPPPSPPPPLLPIQFLLRHRFPSSSAASGGRREKPRSLS